MSDLEIARLRELLASHAKVIHNQDKEIERLRAVLEEIGALPSSRLDEASTLVRDALRDQEGGL